MYAVDGLGLGHVTRLLGLARALRRRMPRAEILFLTASEASHVIYREGFAALKVPSRSAARSGGLRRDTFVRLTQSAVWSALTAFDPHALVVDTFAAGALGELPPVLRWAGRKIFVFRAQRPERAQEAGLQNLLALYDLILVPHHPNSEEVPTPDSVPCVWTGPMLGRGVGEVLSREDARRLLELPLEADIGLISLGGGGDPDLAAARRTLRAAIEAGDAASAVAKVLWVEMAGPLSADALSIHAEANASSRARFRVLRDVHPQMLFCRAFDCAIAAAGYNTAHELQAVEVPTLLWPFPREVDDQEKRAADFARDGRALFFGATDATSPQSTLERDLRTLCNPIVRERLKIGMAAHAALFAERGGAWSGTEVGALAILRILGLEGEEMATDEV